MFEKIARFSVRWRWFIIVAWIAAVPILTANLPNINDVSKNDNSQFLPKSSPSQTASNLENVFLSKQASATATIIAAREGSSLTTADNQAINQIMKSVSHVPGVISVQDRGISADGQARQVQIALNGAAFGNGAAQIVQDIRADFTNAPSGLSLHLTGQLAQGVDSDNSNKSGKNNTQIFTVIFILLLLLVVFRSVLAPLITLLPAGLALAVAQPVIAESTRSE